MNERARYVFWQQVRRWTLGLLLVWLVVNLGVPWFARDLDRFSLFGFPLGYWLAGQGALFIYLGLIALYVAVMDRLEAALLRSSAEAPSTGAGTLDAR